MLHIQELLDCVRKEGVEIDIYYDEVLDGYKLHARKTLTNRQTVCAEVVIPRAELVTTYDPDVLIGYTINNVLMDKIRHGMITMKEAK